jgi:carbon starvation protein
MNSVIVATGALACLGFGYRFYGKHIATRLLGLDDRNPTPAHLYRDNIDYVPSNRWVLFGHHFASISGLGPILGPAIAVIWGWVPALLWIVFGTIFIGGVHDLATLKLSVSNRGRSVGDVAGKIINHRSRILFLLLSFFLITLAMGVFAYVVAVLFAKLYPESIIPVFSLMVIAMGMGTLVYKKISTLKTATLIGIALLIISLPAGLQLPAPAIGVTGWIWILMTYAFFASVLPVWFLLQPRDYLNSFLLYAGLIALYAGLFWLRPNITAPALNIGAGAPADLPPLFPILFTTVACGAISGFHSLVSSGTTAKQLDKESDGYLVGYGTMVAEGILAIIVLIACVAGLGGLESWQGYYGSWQEASGLAAKLNAFIDGGSSFITSYGQHIGVTSQMAGTFISLIAVSFAMTTLDSGTRLLRYNIEELSDALGKSRDGIPGINRWTASLLAVAGIGFFALLKVDGKPAGLFLWVLFGSTNQLFAGLGLLTASVYLYKRSKPIFYTLIPLAVMAVISATALGMISLKHFPTATSGNWAIFTVSILISILAIWFIYEAIAAFFHQSRPIHNQEK